MTTMTSRNRNRTSTNSSINSNSSSIPLPPPKPSHLSSAFTGTLNSEALRNYIQAQKTGDSSSSFHSNNNNTVSTPSSKIITTKSSRAKALKDLYTDPDRDRDRLHGDESLNDKEANAFNSIVRDELVSIDGFGPKTNKSVVQGWLRSTGAGAPSDNPFTNATLKGKAKELGIENGKDIWAGAENELDSDDDDEEEMEGLRRRHDRFVSTATSYGTAQDYPSPVKEGNIDYGQEEEEEGEEVGERSFHDRDESTATVRGPQLLTSTTNTTSSSTPQHSNNHQTLTKQIFKSVSKSSSPFNSIPSNSDLSHSNDEIISSPIEDSSSQLDQVDFRRPTSLMSNTTTERSRAPSLLSPTLKNDGFFKSNQVELASKGFDLERGLVVGDSSPSPTPSPEPESRSPNEGEPLPSSDQGGDSRPDVTSRLNLNVAGPPPLRPKSVALDLEKEIETLESAYKEEDSQIGQDLKPEPREGETEIIKEVNDASQSEKIESNQDANSQVESGSTEQPDSQLSIPTLNEPQTSPQINPKTRPSSSIPNPNPISGKPARALYDFIGEPSFNELNLTAGQSFEILNEQLRGGWSLGLVRIERRIGESEEEGGGIEIEIKRGLVPRGWYCYIQDFTISPNVKAVNETETSNENHPNSSSTLNIEEEGIDSLTPLSSPPISISNSNSIPFGFGNDDNAQQSQAGSGSSTKSRPIYQNQASYRPTSSGQNGTPDFSDPDPIAISLPSSNSSNQMASALPARAVVGLDITGTPDRVIERDHEIGSGIGRNERAKLALSVMQDRNSSASNATPKNSRFLGRNYERERKVSTTSINERDRKISTTSSSERDRIGITSSSSIGNISSSDHSSLNDGNHSIDSQNLNKNDTSINSSSAASSSFLSFPFSSRSVSNSTATSTGSTTNSTLNGTIGNGGWRSTLFGGKSLNRFSNFVTSGVEDYVISNNFDPTINNNNNQSIPNSNSFNFSSLTRSESDINSQLEEESSRLEMDSNCHFVQAGQNGPAWKSKSPNFFVAVHDPRKKSKMNGMSEYTVFAVSSIFPAAEESHLKKQNQVGENGGTITGDHDEDNGEGEGENDSDSLPYDPTTPPYPQGPILTVDRRYSQFSWLYEILKKNYAALILPPLPSKQYSGRFASEFIETRRSDLEAWLSRIIRHPLLRYSDALLFFLSCQDDLEFKKRQNEFVKPLVIVNRGNGNQNNAAVDSKKLEGPPAFFANTFHPEFNVEIEEAENEVKEMERFSKLNERAVNGGNQGAVALTGGVMGCLKSSREGDAATSNKFRELSYSLLRLITGQGLSGEVARSPNPMTSNSNGNYSSASTRTLPPNAENHMFHGPPMGKLGKKSENGATNEEGSWCWREGCQECNSLTKALQGTAECLQDVADAYDDHARSSLLRIHEKLKAVSRPHAQYEGLFETHRATIEKHKVATAAALAASTAQDSEAMEAAERMVARCETVLNVTMAEMDRAHRERVEDWTAMGRNYLDTQIDFYEGILATLRHARLSYDNPEFTYLHQRGPVLPSIYDSELNSLGRNAAPLPMPSAFLLPPGATETVTRPISLAGEVISEHLFGSTPTNEVPSFNNDSNPTHFKGASRSAGGKENSRASYFSLWQ